MPSSGPTTGAELQATPGNRWESHKRLATLLRLTIWALPMVVALGFTFLAARLAPPEAIGLNRWLWVLLVFGLSNVLLVGLRRVVEALTPLVALMTLTLVFPDQAPSRAKATLRRSSSRAMLRQLEEQKARGETGEGVAHGDYLMQLLTEVNEHDRLTRGHSERVRAYAEMLGEQLGLGIDDMDRLRWAALLHDVGKLDVPYEILNKAGRPTDEEWEVLSNHPAAAMRMLGPLRHWLGDWVHAADQHHCRWDGRGYPSDLAGTDIALSGRIVAVADAYDVMTSARSYKKPLPADVARKELTDCAGTQFDPEIVRAFLNISLGQLRMVSGPFGWLVNLLASAQVKTPFATTLGSGLTSAAALVGVSVATLAPGDPPDTLPMLDLAPPPEIADHEAAGDEDQPIVVDLTARGGVGMVTFGAGPAANGDVVLGERRLRPSAESSASRPGPSSGDPISVWEQSVTYRPAPNANGQDSFTIEACDTAGRCGSATVRVSIRPVNDQPTAVDDRRRTEQDQAVEIDATENDTDIDGDPLTVVTVDDPPNGQAILAGGRIVYVPDAGFVGEDEMVYVVADPAGYGSSASIFVTVAQPSASSPPTPIEPLTTDQPAIVPPAPNRPPVAVDDATTTPEDTPVVVDVLANDSDADGDPLTITGIGTASNGVATIDDGRIRYRPDADYNGADRVTYVLSDGVNPQVVANLEVTVDAVNDAPTVTGPTRVTVPESTSIGSVVAVLAVSDPDGGPVSVAITAGDPTARFVIDGVGDDAGTIRVAAALDFESTPSFPLHVEATDGTVVTSHSITLDVADVNEGPVAADDGGPGFTTAEDTGFTTADVTANDVDVDDPIDPSSITIVSGPANGALVANGDGTFDYDPDPDWSGSDGFTYTVTDTGPTTSNPASVTIVVSDVNDAPNVTDPGPRAGAEQTPFALAIAATDIELHGLSYGATGLPPGLAIDAGGAISGAPDPGTQGSYSVDVTVTDDGTPPRQTTVTFAIDVGLNQASAHAGAVVVNEVLYSTVSATAPEEFVELTNRSGAPVDLSGWVLTDANLKADGAEDLGYTVPATDHWGSPSTLGPGGHAVIWLVYDGVNLPPLVNRPGGLEYVVNAAGTKLDDAGDDVWLLDATTAIVDYVAYGGGAAVGTAPEPGLGLWDATFQASLSTASAESIVLTPSGTYGDDSACWEPTSSDDAAGRCAGAIPTNDNDSMGPLATSVGRGNNAAGADAGGPYAIAEGGALVLDGSGSDGASVWSWDLDNDGDYDDATTASPSVPWSTLSALGIGDDGVHPIGLQVDGGTTTDVATLTISNVAPTLATTGSGTVSSGGSYTLNLAATDPGADAIASWTINWGDGSIETIVGNPSTVTHTYVGAGLTFDILASATDEDGTVLQNELLSPGYNSNEVFRFEATTGALIQNFATGTRPIEALVGPDGNVYVSGELSRDVRRYDPTTGALIDVFVSAGSGGLNRSGGLVFGPDGNLYVVDYGGNRVLRYNGGSGAFIDVFASTGLNGPYDAIFGPDLNLYVNEYDGHRVRRFDGSTGALIDVFVGVGSGGLDTPEQMVFGPDGHLYVASSGSGEVLRYNGSTGAFIDIFIATAGPGDLDIPAGLAFGPDGNLYVSDLQDHVILRYDGATRAFIDEYTVAGAGGIDEPAMMTFLPGHQVTVTP